MTETAQQYIARLTGLVGEHDPATILAETPHHLRLLVDGATPAEMSWTPSPTRWSTTQIVAHLADAEVAGAWRIRSVLAQDGCTLQAYDQNRWASALRRFDCSRSGEAARISSGDACIPEKNWRQDFAR